MSENVVLVASLPIAEGKVEEAVSALGRCATTVHQEESGVLRYALHRDTKNPNRLVMIEVYDSQEALDAHGKTPHLQELTGALGGLLDGRPEMSVLTPVPAGDQSKGVLA
jgi:quinol monooxygenase YgiN